MVFTYCKKRPGHVEQAQKGQKRRRSSQLQHGPTLLLDCFLIFEGKRVGQELSSGTGSLGKVFSDPSSALNPSAIVVEKKKQASLVRMRDHIELYQFTEPV